MQFPVMNSAGREVSQVDLPSDIFEAKINVGLMHQAFVRQMANARHGSHNPRSRSEIRATGDVLQDQLFFMLRCGFDAFELREDKNVDSAIKAFGDYTVAYQPGSDDMRAAYKARLKG